MATTTNYGWTTPDDSQAFKLGANAIRTLGSSIDTTLATLGQGDVSYTRNTTATLTLTTTTETSFMTSPAFTPVAGRLYEVTVTCGFVQKTTGAGNIVIRLRKDTVSGTELDVCLYSAQPVNSVWMHSKTMLITSTQMGTSSFIPVITAQTNTNGLTIANTGNFNGAITFKDIGAA